MLLKVSVPLTFLCLLFPFLKSLNINIRKEKKKMRGEGGLELQKKKKTGLKMWHWHLCAWFLLHQVTCDPAIISFSNRTNLTLFTWTGFLKMGTGIAASHIKPVLSEWILLLEALCYRRSYIHLYFSSRRPLERDISPIFRLCTLIFPVRPLKL